MHCLPGDVATQEKLPYAAIFLGRPVDRPYGGVADISLWIVITVVLFPKKQITIVRLGDFW